jgi:hypothetical protein
MFDILHFRNPARYICWLMSVPLLYLNSLSIAQADSNANDRFSELLVKAKRQGTCNTAALERVNGSLPDSFGTRSEWTVAKTTPFSGGATQISLARRSTVSSIGACPPNSATLMLLCKNRKPAAYVLTGVSGNPPTGPDGGVVSLQFGNQAVIQHYFAGLTDSGVQLGRSGEVIRNMRSQATLTFSYRAFDSSYATATFDLRGLNEAIKLLDGDCGL